MSKEISIEIEKNSNIMNIKIIKSQISLIKEFGLNTGILSIID